jgi:hypothetical protein
MYEFFVKKQNLELYIFVNLVDFNNIKEQTKNLKKKFDTENGFSLFRS